jgi:hypothetical protein
MTRMTYNTHMSSPSARRPLESFNAERPISETADFVIATEYRVGRYGLQISRDGYGSRGTGGKLIHLVRVAVISEIKDGYNWQTYCLQSARTSRWNTRDQAAAARDKQIASHGQPWHSCRQPKVGDLLWIAPQCVDQNARGTGAFEADEAGTSAIDCNNCLTRIFGETVEPRAKVEAREKAERAAAKAKNMPPVCFHCGDKRPRTKATEAGEKLLCGTCKDLYETIWFVETTGYTCQYHADYADAGETAHNTNMKAAALVESARDYDYLSKREGKYAR